MKCQIVSLVREVCFGNIFLLWGILALFLEGINGALGVIRDSHSKSFDFIVVGSGAAGSAIAGRLSESGEHTVLLLEAGGFPNPGLDIPSLLSLYLGGDEYVKRYRSVRQENAALSTNGTVTYSVGWTLGGGSSVNGMVFNRGHPRSYQMWAEKTGDPSWSYGNMMKYFKKVEDYAGNFPSDQHGHAGPLTVSGPVYAPGLWTVLSAGMSLGYKLADPNGPQQVSFSPAERSIRQGRRVSSFAGYILPFLNTRRNLEITTFAYAKRILFEGKRAVGVIYSTPGYHQDILVRATKEIIISAGTLESPGLLMKSGIGREDILRENGIQAVNILPGVGLNLQDHISVQLQFTINNTSPHEVFIHERELTPENFALYNQTGNGPYAAVGGTNAQAFLVSSNARQEGNGEWSDIQILFTSGPGRDASGSPDDSSGNSAATSIGATVYLTRPKSTGEIRLNPNDPEGDPLIDFRYFSHPDDVEVLVDGIKQALQIYESTPAFQRLGATYIRIPLPACDHLIFRSDNYWRCFISQTTVSGLHAVGTCSMGQGPHDPKAVVDTNLKVIGVEGLRVADGSVIPLLTNANTEAPIYAVGEKVSANILKSVNLGYFKTQKTIPEAAVSYTNWGYTK